MEDGFRVRPCWCVRGRRGQPGRIEKGLNGGKARITVGNSLVVLMLIRSRLVAELWGR